MTAAMLAAPPCPHWCDDGIHPDDPDSWTVHRQQIARVELGGGRHVTVAVEREQDGTGPAGPTEIVLDASGTGVVVLTDQVWNELAAAREQARRLIAVGEQ